MNINCQQLDDLLFEGSPLAMSTATQHAAECPACGEKLAEWNEIAETAQSLRTTWNNDMLWPRIERSIREQKRGRWQAQLGRIAAALILTVGLGGSTWYALHVRSAEAAFDRDILRVSALDEVRRAENAHLEAIARLEKLADPKLDEAASPLMVSYKEKLMLLDDAIAECEANIDDNRQNAHLRKQLLAMYTEKQRTLQDVLREDSTHVPN
jgi:hypothetical protein